jgi:PilZ domain
MAQDTPKTYGGPAVPSAIQDPKDRRKWPRYPLIAEAKVTDVKTETTFQARVSELSMSGCYLDFLNPLPENCSLQLRIFKDTGTFETRAVVVYNHPGMGIGIKFVDTSAEQTRILERWIEELKAG